MIIAQNWTIARAQREDVKQAFVDAGFEVEDLLVVVGLNAFDITIGEDLIEFRVGGPEKHELGFGTLNNLHSHAPIDEPGLLQVCEILGKKQNNLRASFSILTSMTQAMYAVI